MATDALDRNSAASDRVSEACRVALERRQEPGGQGRGESRAASEPCGGKETIVIEQSAYAEKASATAVRRRPLRAAITISSLVTSIGPRTGSVGPLQSTSTP